MRYIRDSLIRLIAVTFVCFTTSLACIAAVTEGGTGLCYGKDHAYFLTAPQGWVLDTESGAQQGIFAVFYPKGSDWDGPAAMYSNAAAREGRTAESAVERDIQFMRKENPQLQVESGGTITTADGKEAMIRYFSGDSHGNSEAVAYVLEKNVVVNIVLTARNKKAYDSALSAFKQLVGSYKFVTDDPSKIEKKARFS